MRVELVVSWLSAATCSSLGACAASHQPGPSDAGQDAVATVEDAGRPVCDDGGPPVEPPPLPRCWASQPTWSTEVPRIHDVAVDSSGAVDLLYGVGDDVTRLVTNACGPWESVDLDAPVGSAALEVDRAGRPVVAYFRAGSRPDAVLGLWLATLEQTFE